MAVKHGTVGEFNFDQDRVFYTKRLIQYFITKSIVEEGEEHRAILLSSCGAPAYQLIQNLVAPGKPTDKTISETVTPVCYHHQLSPYTIIQWFSIHTWIQNSGETIKYVVLLCRLSEYCQFWDTLNEMLCGHLVWM